MLISPSPIGQMLLCTYPKPNVYRLKIMLGSICCNATLQIVYLLKIFNRYPKKRPCFSALCTDLTLSEEIAFPGRSTSTRNGKVTGNRVLTIWSKTGLCGIPFQNITFIPRGTPVPGELKKLVSAINPRNVVPIHSFFPEKYPELFPHVEAHNDGEWWEV